MVKLDLFYKLPFSFYFIEISNPPAFINKKIEPHQNATGSLTLSWRRPLSYRNQSIDLLGKSMDWFLYDNGVRRERVYESIYLFMPSFKAGKVNLL